MQNVEGLIAATFTPFTQRGELSLDVVNRQCHWLQEEGAVKGVFVCGTTGEGVSLTTEERMAMAQRWVECAGDDLAVIVHVGHSSMKESQKLAAHAEAVGAHSVSSLGPLFFKPAAIDDLVGYCREVAAAAPSLPCYYYHIPSMTGLNFPMIELMKRAEKNIPNFAGVKFTFENLMDYQQCLTYSSGRYTMFFGRDEILLAGLSLGARAAVGSTYSFAARIYQAMMEDFAAGDLEGARAKQETAQRMIALLIRYGGLSAGKAMMKMIGIDCGPVRLPLRTVAGEQYNRLQAELQEAGFFDYCQKPPAGVAANS